MKNLIITLFILFLSCNKIFPLPGEFWFLIDDNYIDGYNYKVVATRINMSQPLFGKVNGIDFMEVNSSDYNVVTSDVDGLEGHEPIPYPFDERRGFDYLRDPGFFPSIGEGYLEINIYQDYQDPPHTDLIFTFRLNNIHAESPDIIFEYSVNQPTILIAKARGGSVVTTIYYGDNKQIWNLLGDPYQYISSYYNNIQLTNDVNGTAENDIKITFNTALMGFPDGTGQIGYQYDPGTFVHLWRGVEYGLSTSHSTYTKNNIIYSFRNWYLYENYSISSTLKVEDFTDKFRADYFPTVPLTVANNLEGGSSNNDYEITWQIPPKTQTWQYGIPFSAFEYNLTNQDRYSATASNQFQALGTTWWFHHWDNGSTNAVRSNIQVTAPTAITAFYKGNLRSNDQNGVKNASQRKIVRTDNGQYHVVYESMGTVWYANSQTSNFSGTWLPEQQLAVCGKNPAIDCDGNMIAIVFEEYNPQYGENASIQLYTFAPSVNGFYEPSIPAGEVASYSNTYYGNAKPVVSFTEWEIFIAYRTYTNGAIKQRTYWSDAMPPYNWWWGDSTDIPGTNANCINPTVTGRRGPGSAVARIYIAYENFETIHFKQAKRVVDSWDYENYAIEPVNLSYRSGFNLNRYPVISLSDKNSDNRYLMVSWQGIYDATPTNPLPKIDGSEPLYREAAVVRTGYGTNWGTTSNFSNNVDYTNNGSLNTTYGSIMTWSESDGQYSKYVRRRNAYGYDPITSVTPNGIHTPVSNGSEFGNVKAMSFNNLTSAPYLLNLCTTDFTYIPDGMGKITESGVVDISYGRSGIVEKNGIEFVFNIGDVLLNGETIKFIERADTLPIASIEELNLAVKSDTLDLNTESELIFSDYYYVVFGEKADSLISNEFNVNFKCELVKLSTGEVVGVFEEVNYNKANLEEYGQQGYLVDCSGIEAGKYYLRLTTTVNEEVGLSLSDIQMDNVLLEKSKLNIRNFKGSSIPLEYSLEQNYPNPFNPTTTIRYQIPKDGLVTLKVYDILGAEVSTLINEEMVAGKYEVNFDAGALASGVYIYRLNVNDFVNVKKMVLVK